MIKSSDSPDAARSSGDWAQIHLEIALWNRRRLRPASPGEDWEDDLKRDYGMRRVEGAWIEALRRDVAERSAAAPADEAGFVDWFEALLQTGPGQGDPLFPFLAKRCSRDQMGWFLEQEAAGEAGFDDLVALIQVKMPTEAKLELARNYWDEMGRGNRGGMHGPMLDMTTELMGLQPTIETTCWQSLALANTLTAFATTRRYAWHGVGALGAVELTAPGRVAQISVGLKRLGLPPAVRKYFELHSVLDIKHAEDWIANVLRPLVREDPSRTRYIAEGALMRLLCGQLCFEAYRRRLMNALSIAAE